MVEGCGHAAHSGAPLTLTLNSRLRILPSAAPIQQHPGCVAIKIPLPEYATALQRGSVKKVALPLGGVTSR